MISPADPPSNLPNCPFNRILLDRPIPDFPQLVAYTRLTPKDAMMIPFLLELQQPWIVLTKVVISPVWISWVGLVHIRTGAGSKVFQSRHGFVSKIPCHLGFYCCVVRRPSTENDLLLPMSVLNFAGILLGWGRKLGYVIYMPTWTMAFRQAGRTAFPPREPRRS